MSPSVISTIVKNDLCIGCGVCAAICPENLLIMKFNKFGEYNPIRDIDCLKECGLCIRVCPFADGNEDEDTIGKRLFGSIPGIHHHPETGYYLDSYVGYAAETRERGSSGGMATWLLTTLLKKEIVDYIIAVVPNDDPDRLFKFAILTSPESVLNSSGSAYYPVELSEVLRDIQNRLGKCAIIGLPCFIKGIRLASQKNKKLREKIFVTIGLVCGQLKSKQYTEYISTIAGVFPPLKKVYYRGKSPDHPANNFYFSSINQKGISGRIFWNDGVAEAWTNHWFTPNACNYCDDVFAECADVVFMDAWLPEYTSDTRGTSLILIRSPLLKGLIETGEISIIPISIEKTIQSQAGVIEIKRKYLAYRLLLDWKEGIQLVKKRVSPAQLRNPLLRKEFNLKERMRISSFDFWNPENPNFEQFRCKMQPCVQRLSIVKKLSIINFPINTIQFIRRKMRGSKL